MTPEQQTKLAHVKALLTRHIEEADSVPKDLTVSYLDQGDGRQIQAAATSNAPPIDFIRVSKPCVTSTLFDKARSITNKERDATAAFIASARTMSPFACKGWLSTIDRLVKIACFYDGDKVTGHFDEPAAAQEARDELIEILNLFPNP